jgi:tripartite-type tricarboxylate transporter receptor subunit TctC
MASIIARISGVAAIAAALCASTASAEDAYPTHPVRVIAASAAGGNPDVLARILSARWVNSSTIRLWSKTCRASAG